MRWKVNISTLMVFRNQRRRRRVDKKKRHIVDTLFSFFPFPFGLGKVANFDMFPVPSSEVKEDALYQVVVCL
jgi:hypothetical protein